MQNGNEKCSECELAQSDNATGTDNDTLTEVHDRQSGAMDTLLQEPDCTADVDKIISFAALYLCKIAAYLCLFVLIRAAKTVYQYFFTDRSNSAIQLCIKPRGLRSFLIKVVDRSLSQRLLLPVTLSHLDLTSYRKIFLYY